MRDLSNSAISLLLAIASVGCPLGCSRGAGDRAIAKDIQGKISADPDTKDSPVSVTARDGKITLSGSVKSQAAQQKIEQMAREESGARDIDDQTTIQPDATQSAEAMNSAPAEQPKPQPIVVPAGTVLVVTTSQALSSKTSQTGQTFLATLAQPVSVEGRTAFLKGATVSGTVVTAKTKGKIKGQGELALALTSISTKGQTFQIQTNVLSSTVKGKGKRTAATTGGGAAGGALIGGLAGGGKGAGIGALVGATAGFVGGAFTGNKQIEIPAESPLSFTLTAPLTLPPAAK
ncbi:MAG TPA: BON domain-containing protein [Candidatus Acidoferrum sp.]|nr:BON domain-containing protein [Candidatus Acidoferrum sp.]